MHDKHAYSAAIAEKLDRWQAKMAQLKSRADTVPVRHQIEFERQLDLLYAKLNYGEEMLLGLRAAGDDPEWYELRVRVDGICNEIENAIDSAWAKLA
ncbi:MAG: hypothetical protein ACE5IY_08900 [bacterium]